MTKEDFIGIGERVLAAKERGDEEEAHRLSTEGITFLAQKAREENDDLGLALIAALDAATRAGQHRTASHLSVLCMGHQCGPGVLEGLVGSVYTEIDWLLGSEFAQLAQIGIEKAKVEALKKEAEQF